MAQIKVEAQAVRYRDDGTDPTAAVGMPLEVGEVLDYDVDFTKIKFIGQQAGAILNVAWYGAP